METTDIFERAYEALTTEQRRENAENKQIQFELHCVSTSLERKSNIKFDIRAVTLKQAIGSYLESLPAITEHKITFSQVCGRVCHMLETKDDSDELSTALFRLLCCEDGETIMLHTKQKRGFNGYSHGTVTRKYKISHGRELKKALAESKRKRPELHALLPALLKLKEDARKTVDATN